MRRALIKRLPALMRDFPGFLPWHIDGVVGFTLDEVNELLNDQNTRWKAIEKQAQERQRRKG